MNYKIGRNESCPCGSGKKYKKCCISKTHESRPPNPAMDTPPSRSARPIIHTDYRGKKIVVVGDELHWPSPDRNWATFQDFLFDYWKRLFGSAWGNGEIGKPLNERHIIMQWVESIANMHRHVKPDSNGMYRGIANGPTQSLLLLSYHLYILKHHNSLQESLVRRMRNMDQYQGARHELYAASTCVNAGYSIEYEDEGDSSTKHPEFVAIHTTTGQIIQVEAKSRHRPGVLGYPGIKANDHEVRVGIDRLLRKAAIKPIQHPFVIFLDLNLPPSLASFIDTPWCQEVMNSAATVLRDENGKDKFNLIVFTSHPDHYCMDEMPASPGANLCTYSMNPQIPAHDGNSIKSIVKASNLIRRLPVRF